MHMLGRSRCLGEKNCASHRVPCRQKLFTLNPHAQEIGERKKGRVALRKKWLRST